MSSEQNVTDAVKLVSGTGPRPAFTSLGSLTGPETPEERIAALEMDIRQLLGGLQMIGREIDRLREIIRDKESGS